MASLARRAMGRLFRALQRKRWYRRLGRRLLGNVTIVETVEEPLGPPPDKPDAPVAQTVIRVEALRAGRVLGHLWVVQRAPNYPPQMEWWILSVETTHPALRGLGIGEALLRAAMRRFDPASGVRVGAMISVRNVPSLGLFHKLGFAVHPDSRIVHEWMRNFKVENEHVLVVWPPVEA